MPRILVADDNTNIQKMVALAFEERGIDVVSVGNGEAAVRRIPDLSPDLVLADVFMPVRNGYEVCEFVKKDERFAHVPVILLVGAFDPLDEKEARRVGADGVLKKPFVPPDPLIAMVTSALEKNPKVAAEMARAREAAAAPPPPAVEPLSPLLDAPARIQPKPLPEFPEPSPEEAALIYGFGRGRRGSDKDEAPPKRAASTEADEAEDQEDVEDGLTANDWRRNAGNFDVPPELARKPAFAGIEDFHPEMFPSEREVPPKRVQVQEEEVEASAPVARAELDQPIESAPPAEPTVPVQPETDTPAEASARNGEPPTPPAPSPDRQPAPSAVRGPGDWMDATAPSPSEYNESGWISRILGSHGAPKNVQKEEASKEQPALLSSGQEKQAIDAPQKQQVPETAPQAEEPFFAPSEPAGESWFAPPPPVLQPAEPPQTAPSSPEPAESSVPTPADATTAESGDTREPTATAPTPSEQSVLSPDRTADPPGGVMPNDPLPPFSASESAESLLARRGEDSLGDESNSSIFAPSSPSSGAEEASERIPTLPPPNREALRDIPFLTPPPTSPLEMNSDRGKDSPSVDDVVAKVLERLGPQLHDLLAEGVVKPLVENLLQNEDTKKQK
ncbi:MAG TPA: response regulator [Candidatus Cybelea sp.]|nr:response regulator [Candidatus Cybelea sp.]